MEQNKDFQQVNDYEKMVMQKGKYFLDGLKYLEKKHKRIGTVDGLGLALRIECIGEDGYSPDAELRQKIQEEGYKGKLEYHGKECGIILNCGSHYKNSLTLVPPLTISYEEIDMAIELIDQLFKRFTT